MHVCVLHVVSLRQRVVEVLPVAIVVQYASLGADVRPKLHWGDLFRCGLFRIYLKLFWGLLWVCLDFL